MINPARIRQYLPSKAFCVQVVSAGFSLFFNVK